MLRGKWPWILMTFILLILIIGTGVVVITFRRASSLLDLRLKVDHSLQAMYLLKNNTNDLLFNSEDFDESIVIWNKSFKTAFELLDQLSYHNGLNYLDSQITFNIKQTKNLWTITTNGFVSGQSNLIKFLNSGVPLKNKNNIVSMLNELKESYANGEISDEEYENYYTLKQNFIEIDSTNDQFWFFTTSALEGLGSDIQTESNRVINFILLTAGFITVTLFILIIVSLLLGLRILRISNINLEHQVRERTKSIQNLLDYSEEGFLSFSSDFIVNPELSRKCESIFGRSIAGENFTEILFNKKQAREDFANAMKLVFTETSNPEVVFEFIDSKIELEDKIIKLDFHLIDESTIMCHLIDITENEILQRKLEKDNAQGEMILRVVTSKRDFVSLLSEAKNLFAALESCISEGNYYAEEKENDNIVRVLHTFKANAAFLRMPQTVKLSHKLETALIEYGVLSDSAMLGPEISEFRSSFQSEVDYITNTLGQDWIKNSDSIEVKLKKLENVKNYIQSNYPDDQSLNLKISQLTLIHLSSLIVRLTDLTKQLAHSNGKRIIMKTEIDEIFVTPDLFKLLSDSFTHILRNMITHGIEFPRHREKAGKPQEGIISISATQNNGTIEFHLADDGAGLSIQKIREKAIKTGKISADNNSLSQKDYIKMIFQPGFSTSETITAVSGHGYGLSAVRESINAIRGKIKISTSKGGGTRFTIIIPN